MIFQNETMVHILLHCNFSLAVWNIVLNWWGLTWGPSLSFLLLYHEWKHMVSGHMQSKTWTMPVFFVYASFGELETTLSSIMETFN